MLQSIRSKPKQLGEDGIIIFIDKSEINAGSTTLPNIFNTRRGEISAIQTRTVIQDATYNVISRSKINQKVICRRGVLSKI